MGWLSVLGKIGKGALNIGTGGLAGTIMDAAGSVGSVLGKQEEGKAKGKVAQADLNQSQDRNALLRYQQMQNAEMDAGQQDLQRKQFEGTNRSSTAKQALIGALLGGGVAPTDVSGGKASGGLFAALQANPEALAAMKTLGAQGSTAQNTPLEFQGGHVLTAPQLTALPRVDDGGFLSTLARIGQIAGATSPYIKKKPEAMDEEPQGIY